MERQRPKESLYSLHPSFGMEARSIANLQERTGRTLEAWSELVKQAGPPSERERAEWLKAHHGLGTNYAAWIAARAAGKKGEEEYDPKALVDAMYAGPKAALRPIHNALVTLGKALGEDVKACPCQTIVPLFRR